MDSRGKTKTYQEKREESRLLVLIDLAKKHSIEELKTKLNDPRFNPNSQTNHGETALLATLKGNISNEDIILDTIKVLVDAGADIDHSANDGETLCFRAARMGLEKIFFFAKDKGAKLDRADKSGSNMLQAVSGSTQRNFTIFKTILESGTDIDSDNGRGTSIALAAKKGARNIFWTLLEENANVLKGEERGQGPLTFLHGFRDKNECKKVLDVLLEKGANLNAEDSKGNTPIFHAISACNPYAVQYLCEAGADINHSNKSGFTPLFTAVETRSDLIKILCQKGADVNFPSKTGITPLFRSTRYYKRTAVLLEHGADPNFYSHKGETPFLAKKWRPNEVDFLELYLTHGADINSKSKRGRTLVDRLVSTQYYPRYGIQKEDQLLCKILEEGGRLPSREEVEGGKLKHLFCQNYDFYERVSEESSSRNIKG